MVRYYPEIDSNEYYSEIYSKLEFLENKSINFLDILDNPNTPNNAKKQISALEDLDIITKKLCSTKNAGVMNHQTLLKNYLSPNTPYNSLLMFHATGTGKTCSAISIAETYREYLNNNGTKIRIICSLDIQQEFRKSIINTDLNTFQCTGDTYLDTILQYQKSQNPNVINKAINQHYQFYTYSSFVKEVNVYCKDLTSQEDIQRIIKSVYSDSLIIIDEAQNLRENDKQKEIAHTLENITKFAQNLKLVLLSATPMYDVPSEIIWLINLLLNTDRQPPLIAEHVLDSKGYLTDIGKEHLKIAIKGRVSFLRGENPFVFPFRLNDFRHTPSESLPLKNIDGQSIKSDERLKSIHLTTSDIQQDHFDKIKMYPLKNNFYSKQLQLHNVCWSFDRNKSIKYCTGALGLEVFFKPITNKIDKSSPSQYSLKGDFNPLNSISTYAPKLQSILDAIQNSQGIVFVYSKYIYSGVLPLAMLLEHHGYSKYGGGVKNILDPPTAVKNKLSYAIITANTALSGTSIASIIHDINSQKNKNGELIKVVLASRVGGVGLNLKRVRQIHLMEPSFNMSDMEQTIGRGIRTCSHLDLPPVQRNCTVFFHAINFPDGQESVDIHLYRNSELKQKPIDEIKTFIQKHSFDCAFLQNSNFFDPKNFTHPLQIEDSQKNKRVFTVGDTDDSYYCSLKKNGQCNPGCEYLPEKKNKNKNHDLNNTQSSIYDTYFPELHANSKIFIYMKIIQELFSVSYVYNIHQILNHLQNHSKADFVQISALFAIDKLVSLKITFSNIFDETGSIIYDSYNDFYIFLPSNTSYDGIPQIQPHAHFSTFIPLSLFQLKKRTEKLNISELLKKHITKRDSLLSHVLFNNEFWTSRYEWLKYETSQILVDTMNNSTRLMLLTAFFSNNQSNKNSKNKIFDDDIYIQKALRTFTKTIDSQTYFLSSQTSSLYAFVHPDTGATIDIPKSKDTQKIVKIVNELNSLKIFGFYEIQEEAGVFMLYNKENETKKPKGLRPDYYNKSKITGILNYLYEFDKYISDKKTKDVLTNDQNQLNAEFKSINIKDLTFELELLLRLYEHSPTLFKTKSRFFSISQSYKNDILKFLNK